MDFNFSVSEVWNQYSILNNEATYYDLYFQIIIPIIMNLDWLGVAREGKYSRKAVIPVRKGGEVGTQTSMVERILDLLW